MILRVVVRSGVELSPLSTRLEETCTMFLTADFYMFMILRSKRNSNSGIL